MVTRMLVAILLFASASCPHASEARWVKGNTHTHTTASDGDSPPEVVVEWYKSHEYDFLVLSDHNVLVDPLKYDVDPADDFILISGEEVSASFDNKAVHVNGLGITQTIQPKTGSSLVETIQRNVDAVTDFGGLPHINHPNFHYALNHRDLLQVDRCRLLEIYNGHPAVNNSGDVANYAVEQVWDILLSSGKQIYGIAVDDAHHFKDFAPGRANPGRGWIMVRVSELTLAEVLQNIDRGNFYASTGVELTEYSFDGSTIRLSIQGKDNRTYVTRFIGLHGQILSEVDGGAASYTIGSRPCEAYVRAKVIASDGAVAWTQPVRKGVR